MNNQKITNFLLKNANKLLELNINEVAKIMNVSPSAITRYCKFKGYSGFKDFPLLLKSLQKPNNKFKNLELSLTKTEQNLNFDKLKFMAQKIVKAKQIYLLGEAFTYLQALIFERKLLRLNINAKALNVASELSLVLPKANSVYLFITHSGKNPNIKKAAQKLAFKKLDKVIIFSISASNICNITSFCNETLHGSNIWNDEITETELPSNSLIVTQVVIDYLFKNIFDLNYQNNYDLLKQLASFKEL